MTTSPASAAYPRPAVVSGDWLTTPAAPAGVGDRPAHDLPPRSARWSLGFAVTVTGHWSGGVSFSASAPVVLDIIEMQEAVCRDYPEAPRLRFDSFGALILAEHDGASVVIVPDTDGRYAVDMGLTWYTVDAADCATVSGDAAALAVSPTASASAPTEAMTDTEAVDYLLAEWQACGDDGWPGADAVDTIGRILSYTGRL